MNITFIIGNGFDLNLGLPTSFYDFMKSDYFMNLIDDNDLCQHLYDVSDYNDKWIDIEQELVNYSYENPQDDSLKSEYLELKQALNDYLSEVDDNWDADDINKDSAAYNTFGDSFFDAIPKHRNNQLCFVNFNYTHTIQKLKRILYGKNLLADLLGVAEELYTIFGSQSENNPFSNVRYEYPHGDVDTGIIFGVGDTAQISRKHTFLKKSCDRDFTSFDSKLLFKADKLIFWGHSLGETDHTYFKKMFMQQANGMLPYREIVITHYGENGYDEIISQLDCLSGYNYSGLKANCDLKLVDITHDDYRRRF